MRFSGKPLHMENDFVLNSQNGYGARWCVCVSTAAAQKSVEGHRKSLAEFGSSTERCGRPSTLTNELHPPPFTFNTWIYLSEQLNNFTQYRNY
jgi:hypothetical protein